MMASRTFKTCTISLLTPGGLMMAGRYRLSIITLILLVVWGCAKNSSLEG